MTLPLQHFVTNSILTTKRIGPLPPDEFLDECSDLEQLLISKSVPVCKAEGFEADDVLGTLTNKASRRGISSLVYTCDLDLLQVTDESTVVEVFSQYWLTRTCSHSAKTAACGCKSRSWSHRWVSSMGFIRRGCNHNNRGGCHRNSCVRWRWRRW